MAYISWFVQGALAVTFLQYANAYHESSSNNDLKRARDVENVNSQFEFTETSQQFEDTLKRKKRSEDSSTSVNDQTYLRTYKVNSILFGDHCFWIRNIFFLNPFYFCPTTTVVEYDVSALIPDNGNDTGIGLSNKFGEDTDFSSPIDLIPAKPRRPLSRPPPPAYHGKLANESSNNLEHSISSTASTTSSTQKPVGKCTAAIIKCCQNGSISVNIDCFERMSCPGPFWDFNPCDPENVASARNAANMTAFP